MNMRASRKGLSPLLAIIIGLVVTIVAGILLAQLYFSYAATISARPAANIEYVDLVRTSGGRAILALNIKNIGNQPINSVSVNSSTGGSLTCSTTGTALPGGVIGVSCSIDSLTGNVWNGTVSVTFADGSAQVYAISVRARSA
jgi:hypothetical protein